MSRTNRKGGLVLDNYKELLRTLNSMSLENPLVKNKLAFGLKDILKPSALQVKNKMKGRAETSRNKSNGIRDKIKSGGKTARRKGYLATGFVGAPAGKTKWGEYSIQALEWGTVERRTRKGVYTGAIGRGTGYRLGVYTEEILRGRQRIESQVGNLLQSIIMKYK